MKHVLSPTLTLAVLVLLLLSFAAAAVGETTGLSEFAGMEPIDVTISYWQFVDANGEYEGEKFAQKVRDEFGINLISVPVTWADSIEKISTFAASDSLPDVFVHLGWDNKYEFYEFVEQEMVRDIPPELYSKYENVNRVMTTYAYEAMPDGKMYHLPREDRAWEGTNGNSIALFYRLDYAQKLGYTEEQLKTPMSIDELTAFLEKMTFGDPDGNGEDDTYGLGNALDTGTGLGYLSQLIYPMFGYRPWMYTEENGWQYGYISEEAKACTLWLHDLYQRGILDPEFAILKDSQMQEKFSTGTIGVMPYNMNSTNAYSFRRQYWEKINADLAIDEYVSGLPEPTMADGTRNIRPKAYWSSTLISYKVDDEKLDRILAFFDWMYGVDGYLFTTWGEEGVDYEMKDGQLVSLLKDAKGDPKTFYSNTSLMLMPSLAGWHLDKIPGVVDSTLTDWDNKMDQILRNEYWPYCYPINFVTYLFSDNLMSFDIETHVENQLVLLIMQSTDFEADWDSFVQDLYDNYNLEAVTEEVNAAAAEKGIVWEPYKK